MCNFVKPRRNAHDPLLVDNIFTKKCEGDWRTPPFIEALIKGPAQLGSSIRCAQKTPHNGGVSLFLK
jgi:hypothetical protein